MDDELLKLAVELKALRPAAPPPELQVRVPVSSLRARRRW